MSRPLRFSALVSLHETQEREARRRVGELERRREDLVVRINGLLHERHDAAATAGLAARDQLTRYWIHVEAQVRMLQEGLGRLEHEINAARALLAEAHRNLEVFRKLQERDALERARQAERRDARRLEEFAARQFHERRALTTAEEVRR
jgi:flagellar export protein FliJ